MTDIDWSYQDEELAKRKPPKEMEQGEYMNAGYIGFGCPFCGRYRLEAFVWVESEEKERLIGLECEKCEFKWLLNSDSYYWDYDRDDIYALERKAIQTHDGKNRS